MVTYLVKLTHTGTTAEHILTLDKTTLNFKLEMWLGAGFGVDIQVVG